MATYQEVKSDIRHNVRELRQGARKELIRYVTYAALAVIGAGIIISFAAAAFDAMFQNAT